jgi:hypothetical protein
MISHVLQGNAPHLVRIRVGLTLESEARPSFSVNAIFFLEANENVSGHWASVLRCSTASVWTSFVALPLDVSNTESLPA